MKYSTKEIKWLYFRLRSMSLIEILHRLKMGFKSVYYHKLLPERKFRTELASFEKMPFFSVKISARKKSLFPIFNTEVNFKKKIDWYKDPLTQKKCPRDFKAHLSQNKQYNGANVRYIWEINRMQFLPYLALRYRLSQKESDLEIIKKHILSWIRDNPYRIGPNWSSSLETSFRLISWFVVWQILRPKNAANLSERNWDFFKKSYLATIYQHCQYCFDHPSLFSSANNHRIGELVGLFVASSCWNFPKSPVWQQYARNNLEIEILRQHSENGINKEEAFGYALYVADLLLLAFVTAQKINNPFSRKFESRLHKIFTYIYNATDSSGNSPHYGDSDDSFALNLVAQKPNLIKSLMISAAIIFRDKKFKLNAGRVDSRNQFYFGIEGERIFESLKSTNIQKDSAFYPDEGHFFIKNIFKKKEIYVHFNAAKLGYLPIAAHGHADALSFSLNYSSQPIFIDPGTFTYFRHYKWRRYFWGTSAHNTLTVDDRDQAKFMGAFLRNKHYLCQTNNFFKSKDLISVEAEHNGYSALGVTHKRKIVFRKKLGLLEITDKIKKRGKKQRLFQFFFHLHPLVKIAKASGPNQFYLSATKMKGGKFCVAFDMKLKIKIIKGDEKRPLGWYSKSLGQKTPSFTFVGEAKSMNSFETKTIIQVEKCAE